MTIDEIKKLRAGITSGEWRLFARDDTIAIECSEKASIVAWPGFDDCDRPVRKHRANAAFIAAAPDIVDYLLAENARLVRLLLFTHSNSCAALDADIPCDCGWVEGSAHPEDLGEVVGEIIKAVEDEQLVETLDDASDGGYINGIDHAIAAIRATAQHYGISVDGELERERESE